MNRRARRARLSQLRKLKISKINLCDITFIDLAHTGQSVKKCYAGQLLSCEGSLTREHYISKNILEKIGNLSADGIPWLKSTALKTISSDALTSKCLCEKHNNYLSPLDNLAGKLFEYFLRFSELNPTKIIIPGLLFERWILKLILGLVATKQVKIDDKEVKISDLDDIWLKVLFGLESMPDGCGLYAFYEKGTQIKPSQILKISLNILKNKLSGVTISFASFDFYFTLVPKHKAFKETSPKYDQIIYRLNEINKGDYPQALIFNWNQSEQSKCPTMRF